ncbi:MAG: GspE/PulE family protein [Gammaproteobacteria bacterium]|uniref:GspE/PulE family protein n=1 Tax=Rhodoferax sp. TaxID=50421 RepID=UPI0017B27267|nr:GspE/PulE family protein [Rhodoferax sp.]MBU3898056.1 GspE/PulE family protein [Gammaproteobacteria bacterium]MBA3058555.1 secretion system protein E [Rhodoferax sp.]MBU3999187.1 GspE/PulE family protein [Gammaproteobacteria bacterium]MBU4081750.1 GspE/PulE family protein [Gammaproteobacteria bacterium]MBU4112757.1 GspE/PulE family protein [Gammaproteobacteria bacterium]
MSSSANIMANQPSKPPVRIGDRLVELGLITQDQLRIALQEQKSTGKQLGEALLVLGFVTEDDMRNALADKLGEQAISLKGIVADPSALALIPKTLAKRHALFPVSLNLLDNELIIASADPNNIVAGDQINALLADGPQPRWRLASSAEVLSAIEQFYGHELSIDGILQELETGTIDMASLIQESEGYSHPVVRLIDALLADATLRGASDVHFEPETQFLRIRYRIDGVLRQVRVLHLRYWSAMVVRLKVMAGMNIAETRAPQDGRISLTISGRPVDFRSAVQPTIHGENFVLRILDRKRGIVAITGLGLSEPQLNLLQLMLSRPEGILLVTGPTGSGKTTTLYSVLGHLNSEAVNIMTLEDPVEYPMPVIRQTSLSDAVKMDFAEGIRSMMRQDPDIILVGEVRDKDTAEMAFRAAMTGHQVFTTLHTNSAIRSIPRLIDLGIKPDVLAGNVIGIIAQRLIRTLCPACKAPHTPSPIEVQLLRLAAGEAARIYRPVGCPACEQQGYKGRMSIMELLKFDADLDELVTQRASLKTMSDHLRQRGFISMAEDGMRRVREGFTTLEEIGRVVDLTELIG